MSENEKQNETMVNKHLKKIYNEEFVLKDKKGKPIDVPSEGNLGLLAYGYKGIVAWRKARKQNQSN